MYKPDGFIKIIVILIVFNGLLNISEAFSLNFLSTAGTQRTINLPSNISSFVLLIIGLMIVAIGAGIWKLQKWALYGVAILLTYDIISTLIYLFSNSLDIISLIILGFLLFRVFIYSYLWQKRFWFR